MAYESGHIYLVDVEPTGASLAQYSFPVGFRVCNAATNTNYEVTYDKEGRRYLEDSEIIEGIIAIGNVTRNENTFTIGVHPSGMNKWRIKGQTYATSSASNITIPAAQPGLYRIDYIVATTGGGLQLLKGEEAKFPIEPNIYNYNFVRVFSVLVTPDGISHLGGDDAVITMGRVDTTNTTVTVNVHGFGKNTVKIAGVLYNRTTPSEFTYMPVTGNNLKALIIYALPTAEMLYLVEGAEGLEAVEPELPAGALFVRKITVAHNNQYVDADSLVGYREKAVDGWKLHIASSSASAYLILDGSKKANFSVVRLSYASEVNLAGVNGKNIGWIYDGLEITISNDTGTDINLLDTPASGQAKKFILPTSPFILKDGKSLKCYYSADQNAIVPLIIGGGGDVTFATQPEMESQTPPDTENNKAVSLFGLWKWVKKLNYLYLNITTANSIFNKIWYDGLNAWVTNKDGVNKQLAYDENGVNIPQGRITTTTSITTETKTNSNLSQHGKNVIINNGANNINLKVNAFVGGNFCATYIKDGTGTINIVAGSGVSLDLVQYTDVVNGKSGSRFMISQNGSTNTFKIFVRNYE